MAAIYVPSGAAREYSPLALNYITGCDHGCAYCLEGNTLIQMSDGTTKSLKDLSIGESIIGIDKVPVSKSWGHRFTITQVLAKIKTHKQAYEILLSNGTKVVCSGDHRWLTDRGWKYTAKSDHKQRPFLTTNNSIRGIGNAILTPKETNDYKLGYLSGMINGDGHMGIYDYSGKYKRKGKKSVQKTDIQHHFKLALVDDEGLIRTKKYLEHFGIQTTNGIQDNGIHGKTNAIRNHNKSDYYKIYNLIAFKHSYEWCRGFVAGIFDAEGSFSTVVRISNFNPILVQFIDAACEKIGFKTIVESTGIRLLGGIEEITRFFQTAAPAISRKFNIKGNALNKNFEIVSIKKTNNWIDMYDITTGTENFIANGLVSHNCYVPGLMKRFRADYVHSDVYIKEEAALMKELKASFKKHRNSPKQVFLSFLTDPYSHFNKETKLTRRVLEMLLEYQIPVSILSKGGLQVLDDLEIILKFGPNIQIGGSLTFSTDENRIKWERTSSPVHERFEALRILHENGVRTWASIEPVIIPEESLEIMDITHEYVDGFKIGKLNKLSKQEAKVDWAKFLVEAVGKMRKYNKLFYIKHDLRQFWNPETLHLEPHEIEMDFMAIPNRFNELHPALL
jgi:DNA repair photolyase